MNSARLRHRRTGVVRGSSLRIPGGHRAARSGLRASLDRLSPSRSAAQLRFSFLRSEGCLVTHHRRSPFWLEELELGLVDDELWLGTMFTAEVQSPGKNTGLRPPSSRSSASESHT